MQSRSFAQWLDYLGSTKSGWAILAVALIVGFLFARQTVPPMSAVVMPLPDDPTVQLQQAAQQAAGLVKDPQCREIARSLLGSPTQQDFAFFSNVYATNCVPRK